MMRFETGGAGNPAPPVRGLELEAQLELRHSVARFRSDVAKRRAAVDAQIGVGRRRMVQYVCRIRAESQVHAFLDLECFAHGRVQTPLPGISDDVRTEIASGSG